ncbi:hypothetical protein CEUSTIGMA_g6094.t1 [Chlamydomonas eustigma]|uniref:Ionotropic glutamate receptor C-terminal domain-containing protein n=1 Tax=Chlamydomonas eustigma TaxID=1157962 RepID=A0A250X6I2_9CHLO|nr:hypothetical protein CEUSTIGMA_g6094.t1 [Chlamydomonas eustigma]|eukprot:GAX78656.1 hypothetical protein CEUSTIGMA_g6094.t1 [Chlamydomonas eustigma]
MLGANYEPFTQHLTVCARLWPPFVDYDNNGNLMGYEIDLWNRMSLWLGNLTYTFKGLNNTLDEELVPMLLSSDNTSSSHCDVVLGNWKLSTAYITLGIKGSLDVYRGGSQVAIPNPYSGSMKSMWSFIMVFNWQLWVVLFATSVILCPFIYFSEIDYQNRGLGKARFPSALGSGLIESFYRVFGKIFNVVDEMRVRALASKAVALAWGSANTILLSAYTAGLTATATSANFQSAGIVGPSSLPNTRVGTFSTQTHSFLRYGFLGIAITDDMEESSGQVLADALSNNTLNLNAIVADTAWLNYRLQNTCDIVIIGDVFQYVHNAFGYNKNLDPGFIYNSTVALSDLAVTFDYYTTLTNKYMPGQNCAPAPNTIQLTLQDMEGMWILVAALIALAVVLTLLPKINRNWDVDKLHAGSGSSGSSGSRSSLGKAATASAALGVDFLAPSFTGSEAAFGHHNHSQKLESLSGCGHNSTSSGDARRFSWDLSSAAGSPHSHPVVSMKQAEGGGGQGGRRGSTVKCEDAATATVV